MYSSRFLKYQEMEILRLRTVLGLKGSVLLVSSTSFPALAVLNQKANSQLAHKYIITYSKVTEKEKEKQMWQEESKSQPFKIKTKNARKKHDLAKYKENET